MDPFVNCEAWRSRDGRFTGWEERGAMGTAVEGQALLSQFVLSCNRLGLFPGVRGRPDVVSISPRAIGGRQRALPWGDGQRGYQVVATLDSRMLTQSILNLCRGALQSRPL